LGYSYNAAQSPAYLDHWLKVLKADAHALFQIASQASKAADWPLKQNEMAEAAE
jgi:antirestriction protein ArdC